MNWFRITLITLALLAAAAAVRATTYRPLTTIVHRLANARDKSETVDERRARLLEADREMVAAAKGDRNVMAALATVAEAESNLAKNVGENRCGPRQCDPDPKTGEPTSLSYYQLKRPVCEELWSDPTNVRVATQCAARRLRQGYAVCKSWPGSLCYYAGAKGGCDCELGKKRELRRQQLLGGGS